MANERKPQWVRLGQEIRRYRELAGMSQAQLADAAGWSRSMISALQNGSRTPKREQIEALDAALATGGALTQLWATLVKQMEVPWFFHDVAVLESEATAIREYHPGLVPGLLQTEDYARAVIRAGRPWFPSETVEKLVKARIRRQEILAHPDRPIAWFVIDDTVFFRALGGPEVMREQLQRLLGLNEGKIRLQVLCGDSPTHPGLGGPFRLMSFAERPMVAYAEHALGGELSDNSEQVETLSMVFGAIQSEALSLSASTARIRRALEGSS